MIIDWLMVIITAIYVVATIIICKSNHKSAQLSSESNEINLISQIVEIEQSRLSDTKDAIDNFVRNASLGYQMDDYKESTGRINLIRDSFQLLQRCFLVDNDKNRIEYKKVTNCSICFYKSSIELCKWLDSEYDGSENEADVNKRIKRVLEIQSHFFEAKEEYILSREQKISKAMLGDCSLSDIKKLYWDLSE